MLRFLTPARTLSAAATLSSSSARSHLSFRGQHKFAPAISVPSIRSLVFSPQRGIVRFLTQKIVATMASSSLTVVSEVPASSHPLIGTHDGNFHCDEALACAMLRMLPRFQNSTVLRTRNTSYLTECDIVVDVGATYDPSTHRYDHHQKTFDGTFDEHHKTKLSSAGLVYKHFGKDIIRAIAPEVVDEASLESVYQKMYDGFIEHIDGIDNGINSHTGEENYRVTTTLSSRVGRFNPRWNQPSTPNGANEGFTKAVALTGSEFKEQVLSYTQSWLPARCIVEECLQKAIDSDHPKIMVLETFCPWNDHLFNLEKEKGVEGNLLYVLFESSGQWRVRGMPSAPGSFSCRSPLPEAWRGVRDEDLTGVTGIDGSVFVHAAGFIGGNKTFEGALAMAKLAVQMTEDQESVKRRKVGE
eukprot:TRINITY_DN6755_c0_g1_i1.p1 TRINITY_DN6755_c0_g1~~TRINITY_DN6755_c0_g1_i1.p1  ORF type:complete len:414 (+),score=76.05 TRINITY_DN6755_c0_g1_i1:1140-2381(+)